MRTKEEILRYMGGSQGDNPIAQTADLIEVQIDIRDALNNIAELLNQVVRKDRGDRDGAIRVSNE